MLSALFKRLPSKSHQMIELCLCRHLLPFSSHPLQSCQCSLSSFCHPSFLLTCPLPLSTLTADLTWHCGRMIGPHSLYWQRQPLLKTSFVLATQMYTCTNTESDVKVHKHTITICCTQSLMFYLSFRRVSS